jgi:poly(A) polymerase
MTTDASPDEIEAIVRPLADALWTQGKRFGTIGFRYQGRVYEITTHRAEAYNPDSRKPEVVFGRDVQVDLSRRDFTVNAMALKIPDLELIDPFDGIGDLAARRLRTPLDPLDSFRDDPLRMLRAARFHAGYDLEPDAALIDAVKELHDRLENVFAMNSTN